MNRFLMAAVVGLMIAGCAEGVEDPQPAPAPDPVHKAPPAQTFSGEATPITENPELRAGTGLPDLPGLPEEEMPPMPGQE